MNFELSRQPQLRGDTLVRFHVRDSAGSTVGIISVPTEQADDLQKHWLGAATKPPAAAATRATQPPAAAATRAGGSALAAALEANKRPGSIRPDRARQKENPMVATMVRASKKNTLSAAAILRSC